MIVQVTEDKKFLKVLEYTDIELEQLHISLYRPIKDWQFKKKHHQKNFNHWNGKIKFIDPTNRIPIGLWGYLQTICQTYNYDLHIDGIDSVIDSTIELESIYEWTQQFFSDKSLMPYDYQIETLYSIFKYKFSLYEIATSGGKTLIFYLVLAYMISNGIGKKMLIIVPSVDLVSQTVDEFESYSNDDSLFKIQQIHGKTAKKKQNVDIVIGTYQSLRNLSDDFFDDIDVVGVDEAHHTKAKSIKTILMKCKNSKYRFGMSGTLNLDDYADSLTIQAYIGPLVKQVSTKFLIENNRATPAKIHILRLNYLDDETRKDLYTIRKSNMMEGKDIYQFEKKLAIDSQIRLEFLCRSIYKVPNNTLVLFFDVKHGHGKRIYDYLKLHYHDKIVYYVDGSITNDARQFYKEEMERSNNRILVASFGTFRQGISIKNIHNIWLTESYKSSEVINQSIGRGLRKLEGKEHVNIFDVVDDFSYQSSNNRTHPNILLRHGKVRIEHYKNSGFPYSIHTYNLLK